MYAWCVWQNDTSFAHYNVEDGGNVCKVSSLFPTLYGVHPQGVCLFALLDFFVAIVWGYFSNEYIRSTVQVIQKER